MISLIIIAAIGQSCIAQAYQPVQYQANYAQQAYVEKTVFVAVENAQDYYAGLVGTAQRTAERQAQAQQATASTDARIEQLTRAIEALQKRIEASEPPIPSHPGRQISSPPLPSVGAASESVPPPPTIGQAAVQTKAHPGLAVLAKSCAGCHQGAASKGGGLVLFAADGSWSTRDKGDLERVEAAIASRRMPKGSRKLTLRESANILSFLDEQASGLAILTINPGKKRQ